MKLENEFTVPASIDQAWSVLLDVPRVAPCLPGAAVEEGVSEDGAYKGTMTIKIGPITARYAGTVRIQESDEAAHRVAMRAQAKDARGQGTAAATITSTMEETPDGTKVSVVTDMRVTGPAAQFGRGVMQDVSAKLMRQFAECLASEMSAPPAAAVEPAASTAADAAPAEEAASAPAAEAPAEEAASALAAEAPAEEAASAPAAEAPAEEAASAPAADAAPTGPAAASGEVPQPPPAATRPASPPPAPVRPTPEVLDLGEASRDAILKRAIPIVAGVVAVLVLLRIIRR